MTRTALRFIPVAALFVLPLSGCDDGAARDPVAPGPAADRTTVLDAASEPASSTRSFEARGTIDGRMTGTVQLADGAAGLLVVAIDSRSVGDVLHVEQVWEIHPPDPIEPFELRLAGVVDRSGVVLNGTAPTGPAYVRAELVGTTLRGDLSIVGFNPQPEPPAIR